MAVAVRVNGKLLAEGEPELQIYHGAGDVANVNTIGWGYAMSGEKEGCITFAFNGDYEWNDNASDINRYAPEEGNIWGVLSERKNREKS